MGTSGAVIGRALRRVGAASAGEVFGRAVNVLLPFVVFALHSVDAQTDRFFLMMAVAFFVFGTVANTLAAALVPNVVGVRSVLGLGAMLRLAVVAGASVGVVGAVLAVDEIPQPTLAVACIALGVMAAAGVASAPLVAVLNADHRYVMPGLTWGLRLVPVGLYWLWRPTDSSALHWLLVGLALADLMRTRILLRLVEGRVTFGRTGLPLKLPSSAADMLLAGGITGLSPLLARWIATFGESGTVSLFEVADRMYGALASVATIGVGSVALVYLARLQGSAEESRGWRWMLWATGAWGVIWWAVSLVVWAGFPMLSGWFALQSDVALETVRGIFLALAFGIPGFVVTNLLGRRMLTAGRSRRMVPIAAAVTVCGGGLGGMLFPLIGAVGIAGALSFCQYLAAVLMIMALRRDRADENSRPV